MATSGGSGGTTTTAEASRKVYTNPEIRERLVQHCPLDKRDIVRRILTNSKELASSIIIIRGAAAYLFL